MDKKVWDDFNKTHNIHHEKDVAFLSQIDIAYQLTRIADTLEEIKNALKKE